MADDSEAPEEWNFDAVDDDGTTAAKSAGADESNDSGDPDESDDPDEPIDLGETHHRLDETMAELDDDDVEAFESRSDVDAEEDPFAALEADEPRSTSGSASPSESTLEGGEGDPFEQMDVDVATDDVWESLDSEGSGFEIGGDATLVDHDERHEDHLVSKRQYCQRCPHFSEPPEVECGHDGTAIVEVVGIDEFRVRNCPMVTEDDPKFDRGE